MISYSLPTLPHWKWNPTWQDVLNPPTCYELIIAKFLIPCELDWKMYSHLQGDYKQNAQLLWREKSKVSRPPTIAFTVGSKRTQSTIVGFKNWVFEGCSLLVSGKGLLHEEPPMYKHRLRCLSCLLTMKSKASRWGHSWNKGPIQDWDDPSLNTPFCE